MNRDDKKVKREEMTWRYGHQPVRGHRPARGHQPVKGHQPSADGDMPRPASGTGSNVVIKPDTDSQGEG